MQPVTQPLAGFLAWLGLLQQQQHCLSAARRDEGSIEGPCGAVFQIPHEARALQSGLTPTENQFKARKMSNIFP